ncbi:MAG: hypothetical protein K9I85_15530 [Saprospiraceae bacterium]|nr:hypothetical protein [Saprospiraceae bacterium]
MNHMQNGTLPPLKGSDKLNLVERVKAPTPKFFRVLRSIGITIAAVGGAILAAPVALPAIVVNIAGYLALAGTVATTVSQVTVAGE